MPQHENHTHTEPAVPTEHHLASAMGGPVSASTVAGPHPLPEMSTYTRFLLEQGRLLHELGLDQPGERTLEAVPDPRTEGTTPSVLVGHEQDPTMTVLKVTFNGDGAWGEGAADHLADGEPGVFMNLGVHRQKEADLIRGTSIGALAAFTESSKSRGGARLAGLATYEGFREAPDGTVQVLCRPCVRFDSPLPTTSDRRPAALRAADTGFGTSFSAQPVVTPCTPADGLGLVRVLGLPLEVLDAPGPARSEALMRWGHDLDEAAMHARWRTARGGSGDPLRIILGGAAYLNGRAGELLVTALLRRLFPGAQVRDVSADGAIGCDLEVRYGNRVALRVEVKSTVDLVPDPAGWTRGYQRFRPSQYEAARRSFSPDEPTWMAAVVSDVLGTPAITLVSAATVLGMAAPTHHGAR